MEFEADFSGIKGILPPSGEWLTVHRGLVQRPFEMEITLPGGTVTKKYTGAVESRWVRAGNHWLLQLYNKSRTGLPFFVRWYIPAADRLCCYDYGRGD